MSDLERLNIILAVRDREFAKAMDRNARRMERFSKRSQGSLSKTSKKFDVASAAAKRFAPLLAALGAGAVINKLRSTVSTLDDIGKTADKIGLSTDALQELRTVAESAGISQSSLDSSMERFNKRLGEAQLGMGAASKMLKTMGLDAGELATMGLDEALGRVADRVSQIPEPTERAAAAAALFGREGVAMVNLLREGSAGMAAMRQEARDLGIIIDEEMIRSAEDAQTKLDLMSRVISAQLNSALIDLAPLLVGGATAIADMARTINAAIDAVQSFLNPQSELQKITDNLVAAMGDEIRQSQLLETALGRGVTMSAAVADQKLAEATARHQNVQAIIAEHRALVLGSDEYQDLSDTIARTTSEIEEMRTVQERAAAAGLELPGLSSDDATLAAEIAAKYGQLNTAIIERQRISLEDDQLNAQLERTTANIAELEAAIANSSGGVVTIEGDYVTPIEGSLRTEIDGTGSAAKASIPELSDFQEVIQRIQETFGSSVGAGSQYTSQIEELNAAYAAGSISAAEYNAGLDGIRERFENSASAADGLRSSAAQTFASIVTGASSASDAISNLFANMANMFANAAFGGLFESLGIFDTLGDLLSFDGGGYTGSGPRVGGLDGKGGTLAMVHPQETIIDHTKGQSAAAASAAPSGGVNINITVSGARGNSEISEMVQNGVQQGLQEYDRSVLPKSVGRVRQDPRRTR